MKVGGSALILPESHYLRNGYVSSVLTDAIGQFVEIPTIEVTMQETKNFVGMTYSFIKAYPTVHQLVTQNATSENIKFFATANYNRGDTFTFNGVAVTAKTVDGFALDNGFFKANTLVECFMENSVLYFAGQSKTIKDDTDGTAYRVGIDNGKLYIEED